MHLIIDWRTRSPNTAAPRDAEDFRSATRLICLSFFASFVPDRDRSCWAKSQTNERDLFWGEEAVKQSSKSIWRARLSGSKLSPLSVTGLAAGGAAASLVTISCRRASSMVMVSFEAPASKATHIPQCS